jgi:hypothetical protein
LPALTNAAAIAAGEAHTLVLLGGSAVVKPQILHMALKGTQFSVLLQTFVGRTYALEYKNSLDASTWQVAGLARGNGALQSLVDSNATGPQRFYRVRQY